jgi:sulfite exporter TauE/SafE
MNKHIFHISGTHCASCKLMIEDSLNENPFEQKAVVDIKNEILSIETTSTENKLTVMKSINEKISINGYLLSTEKIIEKEDSSLWIAIPIGIVVLFLFFLLQKSGLLNIGIGGAVTPVSSFIIGLIASVSSCLAIVGGLVLSLSAKAVQDGVSTKKTFFLFHIGRLLSFALLGGIFGLIGSALGINFVLAGILGIIASLVMLFLGLNLVGFFSKNNITLPPGIFKIFKNIENNSLAPFLVGLGTFFLPCGFTQAMQVSALSSGSFLSGLLIMFAFALGTLPVLLLLSFGSVSFSKSKHAPVFFKSAGIVVIGLALFALLSGLAGLGIINPLFNI